MTKTLHILLVDDSEDDALLIMEAARLEEYAMRFGPPGYSGFAAPLVKAHDDDLPLLIVSDMIGEAIAVGMMRAGRTTTS